MSDKTDRTAYIGMGLILGTALGVVVGMMTAPKSGSEMRDDIRLKAMEAREKAAKKLASQREMMGDKLHEAKEKSKKIKDEAINTTKEAVDKTAARARAASNEAKLDAAGFPTRS